MSGQAKTPSEYNLVFSGLNGAITGGNYLTYEALDSYDVASCATFCSSVDGCVAFNIYFERDPAYDGSGCILTSSQADLIATNVHCSLWGALPNSGSYGASLATNVGQEAVDSTFQVAITGKAASIRF